MLKTKIVGELVVIVFSKADKDSWTNALNKVELFQSFNLKWYPLVSECVGAIPIVFLCSKIDTQPIDTLEARYGKFVEHEEIKNKLQYLNRDFYECSALTQDGLYETIEELFAIVNLIRPEY